MLCLDHQIYYWHLLLNQKFLKKQFNRIFRYQMNNNQQVQPKFHQLLFRITFYHYHECIININYGKIHLQIFYNKIQIYLLQIIMYLQMLLIMEKIGIVFILNHLYHFHKNYNHLNFLHNNHAYMLITIHHHKFHQQILFFLLYLQFKNYILNLTY